MEDILIWIKSNCYEEQIWTKWTEEWMGEANQGEEIERALWQHHLKFQLNTFVIPVCSDIVDQHLYFNKH